MEEPGFKVRPSNSNIFHFNQYGIKLINRGIPQDIIFAELYLKSKLLHTLWKHIQMERIRDNGRGKRDSACWRIYLEL